MFCCETCQYQSDRKYNIRKHITNVHSRDASDGELMNTQITSKNTQITSKNTQITSKNTQITSQIDKKISTCQKCFKIFKTFHGCKKHETSCKGVSNALECHHCHKVLASQQSKSKHIKTCKMKEIRELVSSQNITNNTQNNNTQNVIVHYHNYRGVNNLHKYYESDWHNNTQNINDFGQEDITYISEDEMMQIALNYDIKGLINQKHFDPAHPENHNIRDNCRKSYKVLKNNEWTVETKDAVHSIIYNNSQCKIHDYAFTNLLNKIFDEEKTDEYLDKIKKIEDKVRKKRLYDYIDVKIKELLTKIVLSKIANGLQSDENSMIAAE